MHASLIQRQSTRIHYPGIYILLCLCILSKESSQQTSQIVSKTSSLFKVISFFSSSRLRYNLLARPMSAGIFVFSNDMAKTTPGGKLAGVLYTSFRISYFNPSPISTIHHFHRHLSLENLDLFSTSIPTSISTSISISIPTSIPNPT